MANLFTRDDTLLGICEGIGDEFGVAPNALRIALGAGLFVAPFSTIAFYLACGIVLLVARAIWPVADGAPPIAPAMPVGDNDAGEPEGRRAAA